MLIDKEEQLQINKVFSLNQKKENKFKASRRNNSDKTEIYEFETEKQCRIIISRFFKKIHKTDHPKKEEKRRHTNYIAILLTDSISKGNTNTKSTVNQDKKEILRRCYVHKLLCVGDQSWTLDWEIWEAAKSLQVEACRALLLLFFPAAGVLTFVPSFPLKKTTCCDHISAL